MATAIEQSFGVIFRILQGVRLYHLENSSKCKRVQSYVMYLVCTLLVPSLIIAHLLLAQKLNTTQVNFSIAFLAQALCLGIKILSFRGKTEIIRKCVFYFEHNQFDADGSQRSTIDDCVLTCRRNTNIFLACLGPGIPVWCIRPLFISKQALPLDIWLPYDLSTSPIVFYSLYVVLSIVFAVVALTNLLDPLISGLASHAAAQLRILQHNLQHLGVGNKNTYDKIRGCVQHYNYISTFVELYEDCFSVAIFGQFAATVILLCAFTLQLGMMDISAASVIQTLLCVVVVLGQVYFHCYYGTLICEENSRLAEAVYMGRWYEFDLKSRKALLILMERSKKPMILTAGKVVEISLDTFTVILKRSYSLLAVLKNY